MPIPFPLAFRASSETFWIILPVGWLSAAAAGGDSPTLKVVLARPIVQSASNQPLIYGWLFGAAFRKPWTLRTDRQKTMGTSAGYGDELQLRVAKMCRTKTARKLWSEIAGNKLCYIGQLTGLHLKNRRKKIIDERRGDKSKNIARNWIELKNVKEKNIILALETFSIH